MAEIDCDNDTIDRVVALPGEAREDRDQRGQFCIEVEAIVFVTGFDAMTGSLAAIDIRGPPVRTRRR